MERFTGEKLNLESRNDNSIVNVMKDKKIASLLDYRFLTIKNPDDENMELAKVNLWFLDENSDKSLTDLILSKDKLSNFMVFVVLNLEEYWNVDDSVSKWIQFINERVAPSFSNKLDLEETDKLRDRMKDWVMNFHEPHETQSGKILNKKTDIDPECTESLFIPKGALNPNYGFPVMFILNNSESILEIRNEPNAGEILDSIEYNLRKYAVSYASPIIYTSSKRSTNIELLTDYVKYLFFSIPFRHHSNMSKDSLFIPMGYDNLDIIEENYTSVKEKPFNAIVKKPEEAKVEKETEISVKVHQSFLHDLQELSSKISTTQVGKTATPATKLRVEAPVEEGDKKEAKPVTVKKKTVFGKDQTQKILSLLSRDNA
jgi:Dynein light intermediate chain (DLIC)